MLSLPHRPRYPPREKAPVNIKNMAGGQYQEGAPPREIKNTWGVTPVLRFHPCRVLFDLSINPTTRTTATVTRCDLVAVRPVAVAIIDLFLVWVATGGMVTVRPTISTHPFVTTARTLYITTTTTTIGDHHMHSSSYHSKRAPKRCQSSRRWKNNSKTFSRSGTVVTIVIVTYRATTLTKTTTTTITIKTTTTAITTLRSISTQPPTILVRSFAVRYL